MSFATLGADVILCTRDAAPADIHGGRTRTASADSPDGFMLASAERANDSVWVQLSDALVGVAAVHRIGTTSGIPLNLQDCSNCSIDGWGWQDGAFWNAEVPAITWSYGGLHTVRVQVREDGVRLDQIVLSPSRYLTSSPRAVRNDTILLQP